MNKADRHIHVVVQDDLVYYSNSFVLSLIAALYTSFGIIPMAIIDVYTVIFQYVYFGIHKIPKLYRSDYFAVDRHKLKNLNFTQKLSCIYCGYANGVAAFAKAVVERMEQYSCAIKHLSEPKGQNHQSKFYERKEFE